MIHKFYYYIVRNYFLIRYPKRIWSFAPAGFDMFEEEFLFPGDNMYFGNGNIGVYVGKNCFLQKGEI